MNGTPYGISQHSHHHPIYYKSNTRINMLMIVEVFNLPPHLKVLIPSVDSKSGGKNADRRGGI